MNVFPVTINNKNLLKKAKALLTENNISYGSYYPYGLYEFPVSKLVQKSISMYPNINEMSH